MATLRIDGVWAGKSWGPHVWGSFVWDEPGRLADHSRDLAYFRDRYRQAPEPDTQQLELDAARQATLERERRIAEDVLLLEADFEAHVQLEAGRVAALDRLREDLQALQEQRAQEQQLADLQEQIYDREAQMIADAAHATELAALLEQARIQLRRQNEQAALLAAVSLLYH